MFGHTRIHQGESGRASRTKIAQEALQLYFLLPKTFTMLHLRAHSSWNNVRGFLQSDAMQQVKGGGTVEESDGGGKGGNPGTFEGAFC